MFQSIIKCVKECREYHLSKNKNGPCTGNCAINHLENLFDYEESKIIIVSIAIIIGFVIFIKFVPH